MSLDSGEEEGEESLESLSPERLKLWDMMAQVAWMWVPSTEPWDRTCRGRWLVAVLLGEDCGVPGQQWGARKQKNYLAQSVNSAEVEKPSLEERSYQYY